MAEIKKIKIGSTEYDITDKNAVKVTGDQTINGIKTFNAPANVSGTEQATVKVKSANGGALIFGKEGPNSGTMLRFDQVDGTVRLRFRASATAGAIVWEQPEKGAALYFDLTDSSGNKQRTTLVPGSGTIALTKQIPTDYATKGKSTSNNTTGITAESSTPTFTGSAHSHTYSKAKITYSSSDYSISLSYDSTSSGSTTQGGSVSKPTITITDPGHSHTQNK